MTDLDFATRLRRPWAMEPGHCQAFIASMMGIDSALRAGAQPIQARKDEDTHDHKRYEVDAQGVATLAMRGPMLHNPPAWLADWGIEYTDTLGLAADLQAAAADPAVKSIAITADSPGGEVGGVEELAAVVKASAKPVDVQVDGLLASAAYWVAAQARSISATALSEIGSIGVYTVAVDYTKAYEDRGIRVHVISSGGVKGAGVPGTPVTAAKLAVDQEMVDQIAARFVAAVRGGRPSISITDDRALASGRTWLAPTAQMLGLIDRHGVANLTPAEATAAATPKEYAMDLKSLTDLAAKHPAAAADIIKLAADGRSAADIEQHLASQAAAAEQAALLARAEAAEAKVAEVEKAVADLKAAAEKHAAELAQAKALTEQSKAKDVGPAPKDDSVRRGQMTDNDKGKFIRAHGADAFFALPL
jgi:signal peptide peptidase SppA